MLTATHIGGKVASASSVKLEMQKKLFRTYIEVRNYLLKPLENDKAILDMNSPALRFTELANTRPIQFADDLRAKLCKVTDVFEESIRNNVLIKGSILSSTIVCASTAQRNPVRI